MGQRMSSLPIVQYCGPAGRLSQLGAGRSAAMSTAFHALCAGAPNAQQLMDLLSEDELQEIMTWKRPEDIQLSDAVTLRYDSAEKELEVAIDKFGAACDPKSKRAVSIGHLDFAWCIDVHGRRIAYVGDIKRSEWTTLDGPRSLQLVAYGLAYATMRDCEAFACGIWSASEGTWQWGELVEFGSPEAVVLAKRVVAAATNASEEYSMGAHCHGCYGRMRCQAWVLPPEVAQTSLAPLTEGGELSPEKALQLLLLLQQVEDTVDHAKKGLQAYANRIGGIRDAATGKVWRPTVCNGRESCSAASLRKQLGPEAEKYISPGKPYQRFAWTKG